MSNNTNPSAAAAVPAPDDNQMMAERREKLNALRQQQAEGLGVAFPNDIKPTHRAGALFAAYDDKTKEELVPLAVNVSVAG
ncbi:MAG: lysine--tRNA ligase, partial [Polaromonas sp.]|nr:lysine--tRNA ligase [Polaromonas sp.]